MIKLILTFTLLVFQLMAVAQYCGGSGASQCIPVDTVQGSGFLMPDDVDFPPFINDRDSVKIIQFKMHDSIVYNGIVLGVDSVRIDSIGNLPYSICWSTNKASNRFTQNEVACVRLGGFTCSDPGQYKLKILVTLYTGNGVIGPYVNTETFGLKYNIRIRNCNDNIIPIDTNQNLPFTKYPGYSSGPLCSNIPDNPGCQSVGLYKEEQISALSVVPNPFTNKAVVSFTSERATVMTERVTNMLGAIVAKNTINVKAGENSSVIDGTNLNAGVYFYSLTDGKNSITKRCFIFE